MDAYSARILLGTAEVATSALDLSRRFGIPLAACYRRLRQLEDAGLIYCAGALPSRNGKGLQLFRSRVRSLRIIFEEGRLRASIVFDGDEPETAVQELQLAETPGTV